MPQGPESLAAERAYRSGDHAAAMRLYEQSLAAEPARRGAISFNLGNCAFQLGRHAEASLWYERAKAALADPQPARRNQALAEEALGLPADGELSDGGGAMGSWLLLATLLQTAGGLMVVLGRSGELRASGAAIAALGLGAAGRCLHMQFGPERQTAVLQQPATLRSCPAEDCAEVAQWAAGVRARLSAQHDGWLLLERDEAVGWVRRDAAGTAGAHR
jgi:tetratricopeptide (TPR) repeat protein